MSTIGTRTLGVLLGALMIVGACSDGAPSVGEVGSDTTTAQGISDQATITPSFTIGLIPRRLSALGLEFSKHVQVFGVSIVGTPDTADDDLLHAANVMAQYLDNDADGLADDAEVVAAMVERGATLLMAATPEEFESLDLDRVFDVVGDAGQDLYGSETAPDDGFDASLEEIHHLILTNGWSQVYPDALGQLAGSEIADAMDLARSGRFEQVPATYPDGAWFTYDDTTCDYACQVTEYAYWVHTSLIGGQDGRSEVEGEWRLTSPAAVRDGDPAAVAVLEQPDLGLPTVLPDGDYRG